MVSLVLCLFLSVFLAIGSGAPTHEQESATSFICPLEYPLKERNGQLRRCKPIGSPFCPDTHFCKLDTQDEPGICCMKNAMGEQPETNKEKGVEDDTQNAQATENGPVNGCRPFELPPLTSPDCKYEIRKVLDSSGCPLPPTITCTSEENDCPAISLPVLSSLCKFGPSKNGSNGCPIAPDIICEQQSVASNSAVQFQPPVSSSTKGPAQPDPKASTQSPPPPPPAPQPPLANPPPPSGSTQPPPPPPAGTTSQQSGLTSTPQPPPQPVPAAQPPSSPVPPVQSLPAAQPAAQPAVQPAVQPAAQPLPAVQLIPAAQPPASSQQPKNVSLINGTQPVPAAQIPPPAPVNPVVSPANANNTQTIVSQIASSFNETTEEPPRNFTFEEMLGQDFLHALNRTEMPESSEFRKKFGPPMNASGKFHPCKIHADCFQFREPAEWCRPKNNVRWSEKSCFCATDTMVPSCIVERTDGDKTEWTFCSSFQDLKCN